MVNDAMLELRIDSRDEAIVRDIEGQLSAIQVTRWEVARMDPVTVLAIAAASAKLVSVLLDVKAKLSKRPESPRITITSPDGTTIALADATEEMLSAIASGLGSRHGK